MVSFLVTTDVNAIPTDRQIVMVDGTVPGWSSKVGDLHFDHHKEGGANVQIEEIELPQEIDKNAVIVTTQVDADACCAAAYLLFPEQISKKDREKLLAISYDCDHLAVPEELAPLANFASNAVAAMKASGDQLAVELGLPKDRKTWTAEDKQKYASIAFEKGTNAIINAIWNDEHFPGENGEADKYQQQLAADVEIWKTNNKIHLYKGVLIFDCTDLQGRYLDPRVTLRAAKALGLDKMAPFTLTQRKIVSNNEFLGYSYTIGVVPLHENIAQVDYCKNKVYEALTLMELKQDSMHYNASIENAKKVEALEKEEWSYSYNQDHQEYLWCLAQWLCANKLGWGGRKTVGGSSWNTPSKLAPQTIIDTILRCH